MSRTGTPSMSRDPNAAISPKPQSMPPSRDICSRFSSRALSFGWTVKPSGIEVWAAPMCASVSALIAVCGASPRPPSACCA